MSFIILTILSVVIPYVDISKLRTNFNKSSLVFWSLILSLTIFVIIFTKFLLGKKLPSCFWRAIRLNIAGKISPNILGIPRSSMEPVLILLNLAMDVCLELLLESTFSCVGWITPKVSPLVEKWVPSVLLISSYFWLLDLERISVDPTVPAARITRLVSIFLKIPWLSSL